MPMPMTTARGRSSSQPTLSVRMPQTVVDPFDLRADPDGFLDGFRRGNGCGQCQLRERDRVEDVVVRADHGDVKTGVGGGVERMALASSAGGLMVRDEVGAVVHVFLL